MNTMTNTFDAETAETRLYSHMTLNEIINTMSNGNPGALSCIAMMFANDPFETVLNLLFFDSLQIYGSKLYMLWNDCCGQNMEKFKKTIQAFRAGKFTQEEIHENLSLVRAKPFIE